MDNLQGTTARVLPWALIVVLAIAVASTFAPWVRTGDARRTSYEAVQSAARLDLADGSAEDVVQRTWPFVPLLASLAALAIVLGRPRLGGLLAALVGLALVALAVVVAGSPDLTDWGVTAGLLLGVAVLGTSVVTISTTSTARATATSADLPTTLAVAGSLTDPTAEPTGGQHDQP